MARGIRWILFLVILAGVGYWLSTGGKPWVAKVTSWSLGEKEQKPTLKDYDFKPVTRGDIQQKVLATGSVTLMTGAEVKIGARISGQLKDLRVRIGDFVRAGDLIAVIEHEDLLARVAKFQADLNAELVKREKIQNEKPLEINKARAEQDELQVRLALANKMLNRNQKLSEQGVVSTTVVEEAEERVEVLHAKIRVAVEKLKLEEARLNNDLKLASAMVERARANLMEEKTQLSYAKITAPINGMVAFISTQEGETVVASLSAPTFVTLIDLSKLEVTTFVDETDIGRIAINQKAVFTVDTFADKFFQAKVRDIHPKAVIKDNVVNYEVILKIRGENISLLRPEMTSNVVVTTGTHRNVLTIPKEAIKRLGKKTFTILKSEDGPLEVPITVGWREGGLVEVLSGVKEGEEVGVFRKPKRKSGEKRRRR